MMISQRQQRFFSALLSLAVASVAFAGPDSTVDLNRFTFKQNVLTVGNNHVEHWIVRFCHDWYSPCKRIEGPYHELAMEFTDKLNIRSTKVRFANVDCSVDKPLCNEQAVDEFPKVVHYSRQQKVAQWNGNGEQDPHRLAKWVKKQFAVQAGSELPATRNQQQSKVIPSSFLNWFAFSVPSVPDLHLQEAREMITRQTGALAKASITIGLAASIAGVGFVIRKEFSSILGGN